MEEKNTFTFKKEHLLVAAGALAILITAGLLFADNYYNDIIRREKKVQREKQFEIDSLSAVFEIKEDSLLYQLERVSKEKIYIDEYKDDYYRERRRRLALQRRMDSILYAQYGKHYLDSLAKYVTYK